MENQIRTRRYELDWLRVLAFSLLIFYHTGMFFVSWEWHVKNNQLSEAMELPMLFLSQWRMSLIFLVSGAGVYLAMGYRSSGTFLRDRLKRILVPLVFGMLFIVPPQVYFERLTQGYTGSYFSFYPSVFDFEPYPEGNFSWHHLWYLAYILVYSVILLPLLQLTRRKKLNFKKAKSWMLLLFPAIWLSIGEILLRERFDSTNALIDDWANHYLYVSIFILGFILVSSEQLQEKIRRIRWYSLSIGLMLLTLLYSGYWLQDKDILGLDLNFYWMIKSANRWMWIMAILGFAFRHLNFRSRYLKTANEMIYPFYILHQTVIVAIAYFLIDAPISIGAKFILIAGSTFILCFVLIKYVIMQVNWLCVPFGLKPAASKTDVNTAPAPFTPSTVTQA